MEVPPMYPGDDCAGGIVLEMLPERRCTVRLNDGRTVVGSIPYFGSRHDEPYCPAPGREVTVFMQRKDNGEHLLVGFPRLKRKS